MCQPSGELMSKEIMHPGCPLRLWRSAMIRTVVSMKSAQTAMADAVSMTHCKVMSEGGLGVRVTCMDNSELTVWGTKAEKPRLVKNILVLRTWISSPQEYRAVEGDGLDDGGYYE